MPSRTSADRFGWILVGLSCLGLLVALTGILIAIDFRHYNNSDTLQLASYYNDLTVWGGSITEWVWSTAPYFFPDLVLYFALQAVIGNHIATLMVFGVVQSMLYLLGWTLLLGQLASSDEARRFVCACTLMVGSVMLTLARPVILWSFIPVTHFGIQWVIPYMLVLVVVGLRCLARKQMAVLFGVLLVLSLLLAFSDIFYLVWCVVPLVVTLILRWLVTRRALWRTLALQASVVVGAAAGVFLCRGMDPHPTLRLYLARANAVSVLDSVGIFATWLRDWSSANPVLTIALIVIYCLHAGAALYTIQQVVSGRSMPVDMMLVSGFITITVPLIIAVGIALPVVGHYFHFRYIHPALLIPFAGLPGLLAGVRLRSLGFVVLRMMAFISLCLVIGLNLPYLQRVDRLSRYTELYPEVIQCLDRELSVRGLHVGISSYWDARYLTLLSKRGTQVIQVTPTMDPFLWVINPKWYRRFVPEFVISFSGHGKAFYIAEDEIVKRFGSPADRFECAGRAILVYNRVTDRYFHTYLMDHPLLVGQ